MRRDETPGETTARCKLLFPTADSVSQERLIDLCQRAFRNELPFQRQPRQKKTLITVNTYGKNSYHIGEYL